MTLAPVRMSSIDRTSFPVAFLPVVLFSWLAFIFESLDVKKEREWAMGRGSDRGN